VGGVIQTTATNHEGRACWALAMTLIAPSRSTSTTTSVADAVCTSAFSIRLRGASAIAAASPVTTTGRSAQVSAIVRQAGQRPMRHRAYHRLSKLE
jgi:hypothetical protein